MLLKRHGWNATSFQILEAGFAHWFDDDGCVGYVDTGGAWVAAPPVAAPERLAAIAARFGDAARAADRRVAWFATETRFHDATGWPQLRIGDQPSWRPADWTAALAARKSLREQLRRARAKGVTVRRLAPAELAAGAPVRVALDDLLARWLASRTIAPMGFLVQVDPFTFPDERRYFVAERAGHIVGFLAAIPVYARGGWFFEDFVRDPAAPNGTIELLVDAGMRAAADERADYVTLGLVPLSGEVAPWLRAARRWGRALYDFDGLRAFKAKLQPNAWDPIFLSFPPGGSSAAATHDVLKAFARGNLLRFGIETLLRGPAIVVRLLAILLLVWTCLLALPSSARWFPSPVWQYSWVAFDAVVGVALLALARRWRRPLATAVASVVTADAVVTLGEAVVHAIPNRRGPLDLIVIAVAIAAPTFAAVLLWNARGQRSDSS